NRDDATIMRGLRRARLLLPQQPDLTVRLAAVTELDWHPGAALDCIPELLQTAKTPTATGLRWRTELTQARAALRRLGELDGLVRVADSRGATHWHAHFARAILQEAPRDNGGSTAVIHGRALIRSIAHPKALARTAQEPLRQLIGPVLTAAVEA